MYVQIGQDETSSRDSEMERYSSVVKKNIIP